MHARFSPKAHRLLDRIFLCAINLDELDLLPRRLAHRPRRPLTNACLVWFTLKYPLLALRGIGLIHWPALRRWLKRVPWFAKAARPLDPRGLYRPHHSIAPGPTASPSPDRSLPRHLFSVLKTQHERPFRRLRLRPRIGPATS